MTVPATDAPPQQQRYYRRIIRIRATDSPNVRRQVDRIARGLAPDGVEVVPGVLSWAEYQERLATWDKVRQCVGLDAEFYAGASLLLFPPDWYDLAEARARELGNRAGRARAKGIGIDPAEGGDKTAMAAVDENGLIELVSERTPDTNAIIGKVLAFMRRHQCPPEKVVFDRGGGGKQHADRLRAEPHNLRGIRTVSFGEAITPDLRRGGVLPFANRVDQKEERYVYVNRRAQLFGELSERLDPSVNPTSFGLPAEYRELREQLAVFPKQEDGEGRYWLPPKHKKPGQRDTGVQTLSEMIGHSPDEADAVVLAYHAMTHSPIKVKIGAIL